VCRIVRMIGDIDRYKAKCGKQLHFHQFPADKQRRKDWIFAIRRDEGENFQVYRTAVLDEVNNCMHNLA